MIVTHSIPYKHDGDLLKASKAVVSALEAELGLKLHADVPTDTVHGSVTIEHHEDRLLVLVEIYERDEAPIQGKTVFDKPFRESTLATPDVMPSQSDIAAALGGVK